MKRSAPFSEQQRIPNRIGRLLDSYIDICGPQTIKWPEYKPTIGVAASRYLRPYHRATAPLQAMLLQRIEDALEHAAVNREIFHLWWHPEEFALNLEQNLGVLRRVLEKFAQCRAEYGMRSLCMGQVSNQVKGA
jgi:hypothetical protein